MNARALRLADRLTHVGSPGESLSASEFHDVADFLRGGAERGRSLHGHHLTDDEPPQFQSDKPVRVNRVGVAGLSPGSVANVHQRAVLGKGLIAVSFKHQEAWPALAALAEGYDRRDPRLADDIRTALSGARKAAE